MYSPIGQLFRRCINDYPIPGTDIVIKKGVSIFIPAHAIHHDSRYYYDPEVFNPDRFSSEELKKRSHYTFLPFGKNKILFSNLSSMDVDYDFFFFIFQVKVHVIVSAWGEILDQNYVDRKLMKFFIFRFGQMQVKLGIATLIKNFKFSFHEDTTYPLWMDTRNVVVTPLHPIRLVAEKIWVSIDRPFGEELSCVIDEQMEWD